MDSVESKYRILECIDAPVIAVERDGGVFRSPLAANLLHGITDGKLCRILRDENALAELGLSATVSEYCGAELYTLGGMYDKSGSFWEKQLARNARQREAIISISLICAYSEGSTMDGIFYALSETARILGSDCTSLFMLDAGADVWKSICLCTSDGDNSDYAVRSEIPLGEFLPIEHRLAQKSVYILTGLPESAVVSGGCTSACAALVETGEDSRAMLWIEKRGVDDKWMLGDESFVYVLVGILKMALKRSRMERELKRALDDANAASRVKSEFVSHVSHEIRTPLNAVLGMTRLAMDCDEPERVRDYLKKVEGAGVHLLGIINDVLDFSRIEAGKITLNSRSFILRELLRRVHDIILFAAAEKNLELTFSCAEDVPECLFGDTQRISQILINLLNNAVKFTDSGFVRLDITRCDNLLVAAVSDSGIGIQSENLDKIFGSFERIDGTRSTEGAGLGLRITKGIVEQMHGKIGVESVYGEGSCFTVTLPLVEGELSQVRREQTDTDFSAEGKFALVADDNAVNLAVSTGMLKKLGIRSETAVDGAQAVEMTERREYDVILLDHMMPVMDGEAACRQIRSGCINADTPIIALTANTTNSARDILLAAGVNAIVTKPFTLNQLGSELARLFSPTAKERTSNCTAEIPGVDMRRALALMGYDKDLYNEALRLTAATLPESTEKQCALMDAGDLHALRVEAHGIKGALNAIGAFDAAALALKVENACADGDSARAKDALILFKENALILQAEITRHLDAACFSDI